MSEQIDIEVAYASADRQVLKRLTVARGATAIEAIGSSEIETDFPELIREDLKLGIFGLKVGHNQVLQAHDRVEIYRPLLIDPKEARRLRAKKKSN